LNIIRNLSNHSFIPFVDNFRRIFECLSK
jgi:hypothetical protein